jgi:hypothetical protein
LSDITMAVRDTVHAYGRGAAADLLAQIGVPAGAQAVPASTARFPDGGAWRVEIPSVESVAALRAALESARELGVTIHRVSQGSGVMLLLDSEIGELVAICAESEIDLCLFLGPRAAWDIGGGRASISGSGGVRARGADQLRQCVADAQRAAELGVRCLLVGDEGVLWVLHELRSAGHLPPDLRLKVSGLSGPLNPASFALLERLGADSVNVHSDLTLTQLAELRAAAAAAIDLYVEAPDDLGGFVRHHDASEFVRVAAPVYLKFGLRNAPPLYPAGAHLAPVLEATARERVRRAALCLQLMARSGNMPPASPTGACAPPQGMRRLDPGQLLTTDEAGGTGGMG